MVNGRATSEAEIRSKQAQHSNAGHRLFVKASRLPNCSKFYLLDQYWAAPGLFGSIESLCLEISPYTTSPSIGRKLEQMIFAQLSQKNVPTKTGSYRYEQMEGAYDLVIKTETGILLLEIKKTPLDVRSQTGVDYFVLANLGEILVKSQLQAGKVELILKQQCYLLLTEQNGKSARIEWNNRRIYRIAITHRDFFSLQDHAWIENFLTVLLDTQLVIPENTPLPRETAGKLKKLNNNLIELKRLYAELYTTLESKNADRPYMNCLFLSLPMFRLLLAYVNHPQDLIDNIHAINHISYATGNMYHEIPLTLRKKARTDYTPLGNVKLVLPLHQQLKH